MKPGRKNRFANVHQLVTTPARPPLTPVVKLTSLERSIFNLTVTRHGHLKPADVVLVTAFAKAAARVFKMSGGHIADVEKATRLMVLLGRSLRLTPMTSLDPRTVGAARRDAAPNPIAEYLAGRDQEEATTDDDDQA